MQKGRAGSVGKSTTQCFVVRHAADANRQVVTSDYKCVHLVLEHPHQAIEVDRENGSSDSHGFDQ